MYSPNNHSDKQESNGESGWKQKGEEEEDIYQLDFPGCLYQRRGSALVVNLWLRAYKWALLNYYV